jgi:uncharacterized protein (TIGR02466 family)
MSTTEAWFATPIYNTIIQEPALTKIQDDFEYVFNDLKSKNTFSDVDEWKKTMLFSDPTFDNSLIKDYGLKAFEAELDMQIKNYLNQLGFRLHPKLSYRIVSSWMTLSKKGNYGHIHSHGMADLSGVYYFKTNEKDGDIFFETPNKLLVSSFCFNHMHSRVYHKPQVGKLLLFPGWLEHGTQTNTTDHERVSVSINVHFNK